MKAPFDIAADLDTPVSAYLKLTPLQPLFLLESVVGGDTVGRYSFIGFGAADRVHLDGTGLYRNGERLCGVEDTEQLLAGLRQAISDAPRLQPAVPDLPFCGGLVGATGYDVVRRFEAVGQRPGTPADQLEGVWVVPRSMLVFDHATRSCAVLHCGDEDERRRLKRDVVMALRGPVPQRPSASSAGFRSGAYSSPQASISQEDFEAGVERIRDEIREGEVYQLVLSARFEGASTLDPFQVYRALRLLNPSPYMVFMELDPWTIVGSSPEALVKCHEGQAELRPIAGTRPRGADDERDLELEAELLADPKEAAEHVMLVDLARNDLGRVAVPGTIRVEPYRSIERYSHVMHIVSGVKGDVREDVDSLDLFAATFPAGTVVGAPKVRAMSLIDELEPVSRSVYAGTVGYFGHDGAMDQAIAIRTMWFEGGRYFYQAGAGVVADSDPAAEYREVRAKAGAIEAALRLAEEGL